MEPVQRGPGSIFHELMSLNKFNGKEPGLDLTFYVRLAREDQAIFRIARDLHQKKKVDGFYVSPVSGKVTLRSKGRHIPLAGRKDLEKFM